MSMPPQLKNMGLPPPLAFYLAAQRNAAIQATLMSQYGPMAAYWSTAQSLITPFSQMQNQIPVNLSASASTPPMKASLAQKNPKSLPSTIPDKGKLTEFHFLPLT